MDTPRESLLQKQLQSIRRGEEERSAERRAKALGLFYVDIRKLPVSIDALRLIPEQQAKHAFVAALQIKVDEVAVGVNDPKSPATKEAIEKLNQTGYKTKMFIVSQAGLEEVWRLYRFVPDEPKEITGKVEITKTRFDELTTKFKNFQAVAQEFARLPYATFSTADLFEYILVGGLATRASDIHFEAEEKGTRFRYRIDGILHDIATGVPTINYENLVSRIKLLSGLKLNIRSEMQDGRFTIRLIDTDIEMRVSIIPSQYGETIVMRILDPKGINVTLADLGFRPDDLDLVKKELARPNGLILNTGPTGSGKTTTLYTFLRTVSNSEVKIITIEDPVEYHLAGIEQTQVDAKAGYTFASGLKAILRQDPDIILVGEIRDIETAEIAMNASLTGHLVFSTLHTNDAIGAVPRFLDLGVKPASLGPALSLVIAQRLVRKLCKDCKKPVTPTADQLEKFKNFLTQLPKRINQTPYKNIQLFAPAGCVVCNNFGYKGRIAIYEFLRNTVELQELIGRGVSIVELRKVALQQEMTTLQQDGILKVLAGITTFDEVEDVTGSIEWT